ncbi:ribosome biogenesis GTP-binding protein YihA/YsxC [Sulfurospirillum deleyianum]|uniref:Probable GTP-binding protein EngB n=1 Tax=Sulfurospirillum deleyianum (strain ATCC 51133 / DSM 6946 / 5175) TaxID=525898 RepID=D1B086_SULD5|nr:ribosome biogenesis GTP-binding protein YihA/YsxC [Sulfurospirillum deleyianum]ACZ11703.1 ribosome biogenesis GTP-binding protein YsxC [Sulfurospirillum deleyianum DSM 6946]
MIRVKDASFISSASSLANTTPEGLSEVAFIGRSNVGKSSIINALTNKKGLAKSSSTPGKTRLINFFNVLLSDEEKDFTLQFVDLPGFGYARVSHSMKEEWQKHLTQYIERRISIRVFVHLIDSRHPFLESDKEVHAYLEGIVRPDQRILRIFTKADKLKQSDVSVIKKNYPDAILVSSSSKKGIDRALKAIFETVFGVES